MGRAVGDTGPARFRERFLQGEPVEAGVRGQILNSWERCRSLGLSPDRSDLPFRQDFDSDGRLVRAARPVLDRLQRRFAGSKMNISLADGSGTVLQRRFGESSMAQTLPAIQTVPGFVFAEQFGGTNGIGLALAERRHVQVYGAEHFSERGQCSACSALPVRDPLSGRIEGILCFGYPRSAADPGLHAVIRRAAAAIERRLLEESSARERGLLEAYLDAGRRVRTGEPPGMGRIQGIGSTQGIGSAQGQTIQTIGADELARSLDRRDQRVLQEKAAELISLAQRGAVEVPLSNGRRVTLVSRLMTSPSGVEGIAVEAVVPSDARQQYLAVPHQPYRAHEPLRFQTEQVPTPSPAHTPTVPVAQPLTVPAEHGTVRAPLAPVPPTPAHMPGAVPGGRGAAAARQAATGQATGKAYGAPSHTADGRFTDGSPDGTPAEERGCTADGVSTGLVMVGEPEVGKYALAARRRLELLSEASTRIGTTLDVRRTAQELAETAVPRLADFVTIDLPEAVLHGDEAADPRTDLHRTVVHGIRDDLPFSPVGKRVDFGPTAPQARCLSSRQAVLEPDLKAAAGWLAQDPEHTDTLLEHVHSLVAVPLLARGVVLGIATFYRSQDPAPFGDDDRSLAQELANRAALCIDNARRYTREHTMVLALQRSLLPHGMPDQDAVEVAHRYLPAESGVGGDWYDVIPLSGARIALVVGDVVGHGMHSAATMGRLRTAARNFAELDFTPDEVLTHLDNLVVRLDREEGGEEDDRVIGATCLYAIYDPASQQCTMARAGHLPPALLHPDGTVVFPDLPAGPPLGLGGLPFETAEIHVPEHSQLVLYSDGLVEDRHRDLDTAFDLLREVLESCPDRSPEDTCQAVLDAVAPAHPGDDIALLVARTHALDSHRIATWNLPADPARVREVRAAAAEQLTEWGLDEAAFTAELLLSELVTNAVRYGAGPIQVRLIHDRTLICEVSDTSSTAPHMRRAAATDEGGRGLFLVAQLAQGWGTRYTPDGKVIWAECALRGALGDHAFDVH
ncbi:SpoIIE family protein phosphatase [Streptomyces sp. NPDC002577]